MSNPAKPARSQAQPSEVEEVATVGLYDSADGARGRWR